MKRVPITTVKTVVRKIADDGYGIKVFTLADPDDWELPSFKPGAHIDLHLTGGIVRTYSLCNDPSERTHYVVAVKREGRGRGGSMMLHDHGKIGDVIGVSLPRGGLPVDPPANAYIFVAGGIGVTPFLSAGQYLKSIGHAAFRLHVVARGALPLSDLLAPLIEAGHVVRHDTSNGRRPDIGSFLKEMQPGTVIGCCGPESMIEEFEQAAEGWPADKVHIERFVPPPLAADPDSKPYTLVLSRSGREVQVRAGQAMLSGLKDAGVDVPTSCEGGICGVCKVGWIDGKPVHRDRVLSPYERERFLMVCVAGSASDRLVLDI
jgi:ferredoxin-NADP reductase